jgi:hypothetical protein
MNSRFDLSEIVVMSNPKIYLKLEAFFGVKTEGAGYFVHIPYFIHAKPKNFEKFGAP